MSVRIHRSIVAGFCVGAAWLAAASPAEAGERGMLWRVVQTCLADHKLTGAPFPCLDVDLGGDPAKGFVVVRAPFEASHIIVTPATRVIGIEAPVLREKDAPNYFADAWKARRFVADALTRKPGRDDLAMAVNSRAGRSQDQLHIHVDCLRPDVRSSLDRQLGRLREGDWKDVTLSSRMPRYAATLLDRGAFERANVIALAADGLDVPPDAMDGMTVAVVPVTSRGEEMFAVLARRRLPRSRDEAHGEALLDHGCSILR